jgi:hypothetical protein
MYYAGGVTVVSLLLVVWMRSLMTKKFWVSV